MSVSTPGTSGVRYRRIGSILLERGVITQAQLAAALEQQRASGGLLGEILVLGYGVSRLDLADALAEQWAEVQLAATVPDAQEAEPEHAANGVEDDLRLLLEEAQAARVELAQRTDELSRRLESLESLVVGVTQALEELRGAGAERQAGRASERRRRRAAA
ncbi:MAG TPA: hypothetical protein VFB26_01305 [Gaiellaceae bacterium]|nr:hypothetical protein [Gaiellaceae bacterium]